MSRLSAVLFVGLILGLGWAIRGHFGHEYGACWAGAMGGLAVLVAAKRKDWQKRLPVLVFMAGIGWAVGGMMSYGLVIGFCRGTDFGNVLYGYTMLAVIGGLYGFIGGGLFGLGLQSSDKKNPDWALLLTQMVAAGYLSWGILIWQFEWKMTPPRSELWAACLGAAVAMAWFFRRNGFNKALRVAGFSALGAGFGFSFGNFIQTMGNLTGIGINWWNVMEFTLGFCGGLGMTYAVLTADWPEIKSPSKSANWFAWIFLIFALPLINLVHAFDTNQFIQYAEKIGHSNPGQFAQNQFILGFATVVCFTILCTFLWKTYRGQEEKLISLIAPILLFGYSIYYTIFSHIRKGFFFGAGGLQIEQYAYWGILLTTLIMWLVNRKSQKVTFITSQKIETWRKWGILIAVLIMIVISLTLISINSHEGLGGFHERF